LIRINAKNSYHLNISDGSFLIIFHNDLEDAKTVITTKFLKNTVKINHLVQIFLKKFVLFEHVDLGELENSEKLNNSMNKSLIGKNVKSVPYPVPNNSSKTKQQFQNPSNTNNSSNKTVQSQNKPNSNNPKSVQNQSNTSSSSMANKNSLPLPNKPITSTPLNSTTNKVVTAPVSNNNSSTKTFQFKNPNSSAITPKPTISVNSKPNVTLNVTNFANNIESE
jgi:hypothetical protein